MSYDNGYIKLWRKSKDSRVFKNDGLWKVWTWCLMKASHKERWVSMKSGKSVIEVKILPGQFVYGRLSAAKELHMKPSTVRNRIAKLKNIENLDIKEDKQYSVVSIVNWGIYQGSDKKEDSKEDNRRTGKGQAKDTDKNDKNIKNILTGKFALDFFAPEINGWDKKEFEKTIDGFISLRKQKKISSGVLENEIEYWHKFPDEIINIALKTYNLKKYWEDSKGEKYLRGIIRGKSNNVNKQNSQSLSQKAF